MSSPIVAATVALHLTFGTSIPCSVLPGTVVASINLSGGDGSPISLGMTGDAGDFAISGSNVVVGKSGITPSRCGTVQTVTITARQN